MKFNISRYIGPAWFAALTMLAFNAHLSTAQPGGTWYDRPVTLAAQAQSNKAIARPPREAYSVVVWEDYRNGDPEIYAQMIDGNTGLPLWKPENGVKVADGTGQYNPKATYDALGGVYVVWESFTSGAAMEIWAQRLVGSSGQADSRWPDIGILVSDFDWHDSVDPEVIGHEFGCYCVWTDIVNDEDVIIACLYENGTSQSGYSSVDPAPGDQRNPVVTTDGVSVPSGYGTMMGAYVAYESNDNGNFDIKGVHYTVLNGISAPEFLSDANGNECQNPFITETGPIPADPQGRWNAMGAVVAWEEHRQNGLEIMAQNFDSFGYGGRPNGVQYNPAIVLCDARNDQTYPVGDCLGVLKDAEQGGDGRASAIPTHYCYVAWEDLRNADKDIYVSYFDVFDGTILTPTPNGEAVSTEQNDQTHPDLEIQHFANVGVCWDTYLKSAPKVNFQEFSLDLTTYSGPLNGWLVANMLGGQSLPFIGKGILTFDDMRNNNPDIYTQKLESYVYGAAGVTSTLNALWKGTFVSKLTTDPILSKDAVMDNGGCTYVAWSTGNINDSTMVYVQKLSERGVPLWRQGGIPLGKIASVNLNPVICAGNTGSAYVAWSAFDGTDSTYVAYIRNDGEVTMRMPVGPGSLPDIDRDDNLSNGAYIACTAATYVHVYEVDSTGNPSQFQMPYPPLRCYLYGPQIARKATPNHFYVVAAHAPADYKLYSWSPGTAVAPTELYGDYGFAAEGDNGGGGIKIIARSKVGLDWYVSVATAAGVPTQLKQIQAGEVASGFVIDNKTGQSYVAWNHYDGSDYQLICAHAANGSPYTLATSLNPIHADVGYADAMYVAWEYYSGGGSVIRAQALNFSQNPPTLWYADRDVNPGTTGTDYQTLPLIATNPAQWNPPAIFMEERFQILSQWNNAISAVRIYDYVDVYNQHDIAWYKTKAAGNAIPSGCELGAPYPNPYSLNSGAALSIPVQSGSETIRSFSVFNMLGQEVLTVPIALQGTGDLLAISPAALRQNLKPGIYMVVANTGARLVSKTITITH